MTQLGGLRAIAASEIEITDIARYAEWLAGRWGVAESLRANASPKVVDTQILAAGERDYIEAISVEDVRLFAVIKGALDRGAVSIRGRDLAI